MIADADVAVPAALIGDPTRASFLLALADGEALPAGELARRAGVTASTASTHLAKLLNGRLVAAERRGRQRYFRLASPSVAGAIEALAVIAPKRPANSLREATRGEALVLARTCYDHLAGKLGVALAEALERNRLLTRSEERYELTGKGGSVLASFGLDLETLRLRRRAFARPCLDWSECRPHLAGALGAAFAERLFELGWIERAPTSRAVRITAAGRAGLRGTFRIESEELAAEIRAASS